MIQAPEMPTGLLLDLDDTLYDYAPADELARSRLYEKLATELDLDVTRVQIEYDAARARVKGRLGERASAHSRLLYLTELAHRVGRPDALARVRRWEREFWDDLIDAAPLREGALDFLAAFRGQGGRIAIVTDLTLSTQLLKLEKFGLVQLIDALVASEEVQFDKPETEIFLLGANRIEVAIENCVVVGDSPKKDGEAARRLGIRYLQSRSSCGIAGGLDFHELTRELVS